MDGILLVDKPAGISSFGVVARVRGLIKAQTGQKIKIGHTGTLDPFAAGLLILVVGKYTKRAGEFSKLDKTYEAEIGLGQTSTTGDPEGDIADVSDRVPAEAEIEGVLRKFVGQISQTPPAFSAIKVEGQRAYKLARAGRAIELKPRQVQIYSLELLNYQYPLVKIEAHVGSGTYIRSLAEDIGKELGTGAYLSNLRRTSVGYLEVKNALKIEDLTNSEIANVLQNS